MGIPLASNFDLNTTQHLDSRQSKPSMTDALAVEFKVTGMLVYIEDEDKYYAWDGTQYNEFVSGGAEITVVDNLTSTDSASALSANQGKVLNDRIDTIVNTEPTPTNITSTSLNVGGSNFNRTIDLTTAQLNSLTNADTALQPSDIQANLTTVNSGYALDANQGKILNDRINALPAPQATNLTSTNLTVGGSGYNRTIALNATQVSNIAKGGTSLQASNIANNLTTTTTGSILDASQGKVLNDRIDDIVATGSSPTDITSTSLTVGGSGFNRTVDLTSTQVSNIAAGGTSLQPNNVVNNLTTTTAGSVLDARQGAALKSQLDAIVSTGSTPTDITSSSLAIGGTNFNRTVDLTAAQVASLAKADSALQTETDPTVDGKISMHNGNLFAHNGLFGGKVNKGGDTMTGALTLAGAPTAANMAATKDYVDTRIAALESQALTFVGFITTTTPTNDVREGNLWYNTSLSAGAAPDTSFPWQVKTYTSGAWSGSTTAYTPNAMDLWQDSINNESWYYVSSLWERIDFGGSTFNTNQFTVNNGNVSLKSGGITNNEIATNANIDVNKLSGLTALLSSKADKVVPATANNIAILDANGNLADGGVLTSDIKATNIVSETLDVAGTAYSRSIELPVAIQTNIAKGGTALQPANIANNLTTTTAGSVLDASQGKVLADQINDIVSTGSTPTAITSTNLTVGGSGFNRTINLSTAQVNNIAAGGTALQNVTSTNLNVGTKSNGSQSISLTPAQVTSLGNASSALQDITTSTLIIDQTNNTATIDLTENQLDSLALADTSLQPSNIVNNLTTTTTGSVLDASQGKVLNDKINAIPGGQATNITSTNLLVGGSGYARTVNLSLTQMNNIALAASALQTTDIVNNLTSTAIASPLSANQGRVLKGLIDDISSTGSTPTDITSTNLTVGGSGFNRTIALSATQATNIALGGTSLQPSSVVNNLTSTSTTAPLSANQGKALNDKIDALPAPQATAITSTNLTVGGSGYARTIALTAAQVASLGKADSALQPASINNTLTSTSTTVPLSASQGKVLNDKITALPAPQATAITSTNLTIGGSGYARTVNLSTAQVNNIAAGGTSLQPSNVVNNLTSTSATNVLSANQGRVLAGLIEDAAQTVTWTDTTNNTNGFGLNVVFYAKNATIPTNLPDGTLVCIYED